MSLLPLVTAIMSGAFAALVLSRFVARRHAYQLMWGIGLAMFAVASLAGFLARSSGATDTEYRTFYLFGAILNVSWLALGTLFLLAPRGVAWAAFSQVMLLSVLATYVVLTSPVNLPAAIDTGRGFDQAVPLPRILAGIGSGLGSLILIGGALWSAWFFYRRRREGRRAVANLLIAAGVLVAAFGGTAAFTGASGVLETANLVGISIMFIGFLLI